MNVLITKTIKVEDEVIVMTLYLIGMSRPRTVFLNVAPDLINFFWRTGGGAQCSIITTQPDKAIEVYKQKYNSQRIQRNSLRFLVDSLN